MAKTRGNPPAGNLSPENYEIALPLTYTAFGAVPAAKPVVEAHAAARPAAEKEPWSDANKKEPDTTGVGRHYYSLDSENRSVDGGDDPHGLAQKLRNHNGGPFFKLAGIFTHVGRANI